MFLRVDFEKEMFCDLYGDLYKRLLSFGNAWGTDPQVIKQIMLRLFTGDPAINLLVDISEITGKVTAHCLISFFLNEDKETYTAFCEQLQVDTGHNTPFVELCIQYVQGMVNVDRIRMLCTDKTFRAYTKKYQFNVVHVLMERKLTQEV